MNIFQLHCFLAVADTLSFAKAARQMNISQPAVTHQIKALETELNVQLFRRSTRMVELTPAGQAFTADAKSIVSIAEQAKLRFAHSDRTPIQTISIGCGTDSLLDLFTAPLHKLSSEYPNLHPRIHVSPHERLIQLLKSDAIDAVLDIRKGTEPESKLTFRALRHCPLAAVCRTDHPLAGREQLSLPDLSRENLIFCTPLALSPDAARLQWQLAEGRTPAELHFCSSYEAAAVLAAAGLGLAILPDLLIPRKKGLATLPVADAPQLSLGLFYKPRPSSPVVKRLIQLISCHFDEDPA